VDKILIALSTKAIDFTPLFYDASYCAIAVPAAAPLFNKSVCYSFWRKHEALLKANDLPCPLPAGEDEKWV
jgi:hypothetical protein